MSVRLRLAFLYTVVLSITLALGGVILLVLLRRALVAEVDRSLVTLAQEFNTTRFVQDAQPRLRVLTPQSSTPETFVEVFNRNGVVTASSPNLTRKQLVLDPALIAAAADSTPRFVTVNHGGVSVRVYIAPIHTNDRMRGTIALGRSLASLSGTLLTVRRTLIRSDLALIVLAFLSGMGLARVTLRPIDRMTRTAAAIGDGLELSRRVEYQGPPDEIGRLAATMNRMLEQMETAYRGQQDALEAQRRFVADASHDLRTPLTSVLGNLQFLARAEQLPSDEVAAVLHDIGSSMSRMGRLLDSLLALARADSGQLQLTCAAVDITTLLQAVAREAEPLKPDVVILVNATAGLQAAADVEQLHRALLALVDNGLKNTLPGGTVQLAAEAASGRVLIHVIDTGIGIAPEHLASIFERFYRIDPARSDGGTGLGLSVARGIVSAMKGTITVTSTFGDGACFTVDLPAASQMAV